MSEKERLIWALEILKKYNPLRNDFDAYLYSVCEYALGKEEEKPELEYYGLPPEKD
jgi:hypothetical protein